MSNLIDNQNELIRRALDGDRAALEALVGEVQRPIYNVAVRFLWEPMDAEDATQEILIKVITNLSRFRSESAFQTWVYRVATNHLLNLKQRRVEHLTYEEGASHLGRGLTRPDYDAPDRVLLAEEAKIACSTSMLICLSRPMRLAYILGEILEFDSNEAGEILEVTPATFRKRLSLARGKIRGFMSGHCGLYNPSNPCRCSKQIHYDLEIGRIQKDNLRFADGKNVEPEQLVEQVETALDAVSIFRSHPSYSPPAAITKAIRQTLAVENIEEQRT